MLLGLEGDESHIPTKESTTFEQDSAPEDIFVVLTGP